MKKIFFMTIAFLFFYACDPGGFLLTPNGMERIKKEYSDFSLEFSIRTIGNYNYYLAVLVETKKKLSIHLNSLKVLYKGHNTDRYDHEVKYRIKNNNQQSEFVELEKGQSGIFYSFDLYGLPKQNDSIILYAKDFISNGNGIYSLDTLAFTIPDDY
ncbi:MAG: hypothetical protein PVH88_15525 [Ignavibacteria bacterium]